MEPDLKEFLSKGKVKEEVICRLEKEDSHSYLDIESLDDFKSLRKEELQLILDRGVSIGQFSKLVVLWESLQRDRSPNRSASPVRKLAVDSTGKLILMMICECNKH